MRVKVFTTSAVLAIGLLSACGGAEEQPVRPEAPEVSAEAPPPCQQDCVKSYRYRIDGPRVPREPRAADRTACFETCLANQ
ncbi:MAG: hypothetical protein ABW123_18905 [Cystobacter sp.]